MKAQTKPVMVTIHLHNVLFFAYHGIYDSEKVQGNQFEVNLDVAYEEGGHRFESIEQTLDYAGLYEILQQKMGIATPLMEKVCTSIIEAIKQEYPYISLINISIFKLKPPIEGLNGKAGVSIRKIFEH